MQHTAEAHQSAGLDALLIAGVQSDVYFRKIALARRVFEILIAGEEHVQSHN